MSVLAGGLARHHDVTVLAPGAPGAAAADRELPYRVGRFAAAGGRCGKVWSWLGASRGAVRDADVVLCGHVAVAPAAWWWGRLYGKPYVVYVHALEITARRWRPVIGFFLRGAAGIVTGSRYGRQLVDTRFGIPASRVALVPPAVPPALVDRADPAPLPASRKAPGDRVLLSVARLKKEERYKGHDVVVRALPYIHRSVPRCFYWVVGAGDDEPWLRALAREAGVEEFVVFWGEVEDVAPFYRDCDVFIMVSRQVRRDGIEKAEGFGLVYLEASLFRKPVVAGRVAGALDAVVDGETGLLVNPESPEEVAAAVVGLLSSPGQRARFGAAGRARVLSSFTAAHQAARVQTAVGEWLKGGTAAGYG
jgi:phosphatidylinositol alpha-1,6-mannosyltransferase